LHLHLDFLQLVTHPLSIHRIAVNGGCLHPEFDSPKGVIEDLKKKGALTSEKLEQMERKNLARRSPYPTLIIEVKSEPKSIEEEQKRIEEEKSVDRVDMVSDLSDVVKQLEAIYAKSAAMHKGSDKPSDDLFYKSIGYVSQLQTIHCGSLFVGFISSYAHPRKRICFIIFVFHRLLA
jgi:hypothetical protein